VQRQSCAVRFAQCARGKWEIARAKFNERPIGTTPVGRRVIDGRGDMKGEMFKRSFCIRQRILYCGCSAPARQPKRGKIPRRARPTLTTNGFCTTQRAGEPPPTHSITVGERAQSGPQILYFQLTGC